MALESLLELASDCGCVRTVELGEQAFTNHRAVRRLLVQTCHGRQYLSIWLWM